MYHKQNGENITTNWQHFNTSYDVRNWNMTEIQFGEFSEFFPNFLLKYCPGITK